MIRKRPTRLQYGQIVSIIAVTAAVVMITAAIAGPSGEVARAEAWLLPPGSYPISACLVQDEVWVTLEKEKAIAVFDRAGQRKQGVQLEAAPTLLAYDAARSKVYATTPAAAAMYVVDVETHAVVGTLKLETPAVGVTLAGDHAYVNSCEEPLLYVVDLLTGEVSASIQLSQPGFESVLVGDSLYVATGVEPGPNNQWRLAGSAVDIVDVPSRRLLKTLPIPGANLRALAWDGDRYVYAASNVRPKLVRIDTADRELDDAFGIAVCRANDMVIDPVRRVAILACEGADETLCIVSLAADMQIRQFHGGQGFMAIERGNDDAIRHLWVPNCNGDHLLSIDAATVIPAATSPSPGVRGTAAAAP